MIRPSSASQAHSHMAPGGQVASPPRPAKSDEAQRRAWRSVSRPAPELPQRGYVCGILGPSYRLITGWLGSSHISENI